MRAFAAPRAEDSTADPADEGAGRGGRVVRTTLTIAVGIGLIAWLLHHAGVDEVAGRLSALGWSGVLVLLPYAVIAFFDSRGWRVTLSPESQAHVPLWRLYLVRMAGEAINSVTPTAAVGGEPVKALLLRRWGVPGSEAVASLVITKTALTVTQSLFVVIGLAALFEHQELRWLGVGLLALLLGLCGGFAMLLVTLQRRGPVTTVWRWLHRIMPRAGFVQRLEHTAQSIDERLQEFYRLEHGSFAWSALWHMLGWLTGIWEIHLLMQLIGHPISWQEALIIESLAQPIRATAVIVPGAVGTQEVGGAAVCAFLGIPEAAGVTLWILKRARELVFDGLGLLYLLPQTARGGASA